VILEFYCSRYTFTIYDLTIIIFNKFDVFIHFKLTLFLNYYLAVVLLPSKGYQKDKQVLFFVYFKFIVRKNLSNDNFGVNVFKQISTYLVLVKKTWLVINNLHDLSVDFPSIFDIFKNIFNDIIS